MSLPPSILARFAADLAGLDHVEGRLALAVSGGPDSLALLLLAHAVRPDGIVAATVDHGLREEAAAEAAIVGDVCAGLGVAHAILRVAVTPASAGLQAAAREARYRALAAWGGQAGATALATAHHLDDRAETTLMRLARGAGVGGLAGIRPRRLLDGAPGLALVRPLLGWRKAELEAIVAQAGLAAARDPSNGDARFHRTAVRALLAREPLLDPARLAHAAAALADAEDALAWAALRLWGERAGAGADGAITLDATGLPRELRRRLLARAVPHTRGDALVRLLDRLDRGEAGMLGDRVVRPCGGGWLIAPAPPRRRAAG